MIINIIHMKIIIMSTVITMIPIITVSCVINYVTMIIVKIAVTKILRLSWLMIYLILIFLL